MRSLGECREVFLELLRNTGFKEEWILPLGEALDLGETEFRRLGEFVPR